MNESPLMYSAYYLDEMIAGVAWLIERNNSEDAEKYSCPLVSDEVIELLKKTQKLLEMSSVHVYNIEGFYTNKLDEKQLIKAIEDGLKRLDEP